MKYIIQEGTFKRSKHIFIFTGLFLIALFGYQLYRNLMVDDFNKAFPGDWDKVIGIAVGVFLVFRSNVFNVRSRDLFIEVNDTTVKYRMNRTESIKKINRLDINKVIVKKGKVLLDMKDSEAIVLADFNKIRIREERKKSIIEGLKKSLNVL